MTWQSYICFVINEEACPHDLQVACHKNRPCTYTSKSYKFKKVLFKEAIEQQLPDDFDVLNEPIGICIEHNRKPPKRAKMINNGDDNLVRPDQDNLDKFVIDCVKDLVIADDSLVCARPGIDHKKWHREPSVVITIYRKVDENGNFLGPPKKEEVPLKKSEKKRRKTNKPNIFRKGKLFKDNQLRAE